ncbi:aminoglycoside phosphotransferase [bacterium]|nr:aminoglycoside phosphotransferase [bacterium]
MVWLENLPSQVQSFCRLWQLELEDQPWHGYLGLVWPVRRGPQPLALKLTWVDEETRQEAVALRAWNGRGAVLLMEAEAGALLLERLDARHSLLEEPLGSALKVIADLLNRLSVDAPAGFVDMQTYTVRLHQQASRHWSSLGQPFPGEWLKPPPVPVHARLVNQDLHYANVLKGQREPWLAIDPKPLCGDPEFALAPLLWNRSDEGDLQHRFQRILQRTRWDPARALEWTQFRVLDYWLWALERGFDRDCELCSKLTGVLRAIR